VNAYQLAATGLLLGIAPCALVCTRARPADGLAALTLAGVLATLALLCLAEGYHRGTYFTVALVCAVLTWIGALVFARFLSRLP
jgi:multicomponent Na+:H+ antiporter subunit F